MRETYWRPGQVASLLKVAPETVTGWCKSGKLKAEQTASGQWLVTGSEVSRALLQAQVDGNRRVRR